MTDTHPAARKFDLGKVTVQVFGGMLAGAAASYLFLGHVENLRIADGVALIVALVCVIAALRLFAESFNPAKVGARLEVEGEGTPKEAAAVRVQALLLIVTALGLIWPPIGAVIGAPTPLWTYAIVAACALVSVGYTVRFFRVADEFQLERTKTAGWWTYFIGYMALLVYASAERLGLAPALTSWDVVVGLSALALLAPLFAGHGKPRRG